MCKSIMSSIDETILSLWWGELKEKASKKEGGEKVVGRKVLDRRECQLINTEEMTELQNHHLPHQTK